MNRKGGLCSRCRSTSGLTVPSCEVTWHAGRVRTEPLTDASSRLVELADEIESSRVPVVLTRPGHPDLILLPADELASLEETVLWLQDAAARDQQGESPGEGEKGPGLNEAEVRIKYGHLLRPRGTT
jgi:PHD/YefM family antitoxin component YafN of YafNO toxin-antitoxin module